MLEKNDLQRKNEYCLREHSKLYEASRLIDKSDCFPNKEEIKKEIDAMLRKLQQLEIENMHLKQTVIDTNDQNGQNESNLLVFLVKLEMFRLNRVNQMLVVQLTDKQSIIDGLNKSIDNLKNDFQERLIESQKQLDALEQNKNKPIQDSRLKSQVLKLQEKIHILESQKSELEERMHNLSSQLVEQSSNQSLNSKRENNISDREHSNSMPSSLLLTLLRQIYQKIEHQAITVYKTIKGTSSVAEKLLNIAPQINYAINQGLSTLDYELFIQTHEIAMKSISYVSSLPFFKPDNHNNYNSNYTDEMSINSPVNNQYFQNNQVARNNEYVENQFLDNHNNLMMSKSSTYQDEDISSRGTDAHTFQFRMKDQESIDFRDGVEKLKKKPQMAKFDDGNIQIQDEDIHENRGPSEKYSSMKPSLNDGMIVSEIITADKIMDQNSHSNRKNDQLDQLHHLDTSPFQNNFSEDQNRMGRANRGIHQQKTEKKVYNSNNSNSLRQSTVMNNEDEEEDHGYIQHSYLKNNKTKVMKHFNVPLMESLDFNLMATNDPSSCASLGQNINNGHISFNTHGGATNDQNKLIENDFNGTFQKFVYDANTSRDNYTPKAQNYDTQQSADFNINSNNNKNINNNNYRGNNNNQYNVRPVSFTVVDHMRHDNNVIAGEDPDTMNEDEQFNAREPEMGNTDVFFAKPVEEAINSSVFDNFKTEDKLFEKQGHNYKQDQQLESDHKPPLQELKMQSNKIDNEKNQGVVQQPDSIQYNIKYDDDLLVGNKENPAMTTSTLINVNLNNKWSNDVQNQNNPPMHNLPPATPSYVPRIPIGLENKPPVYSAINTVNTHPQLSQNLLQAQSYNQQNIQRYPQSIPQANIYPSSFNQNIQYRPNNNSISNNQNYLNGQQYLHPDNYNAQKQSQAGMYIHQLRIPETPKESRNGRDMTSSFNATSVSMPRDMKASSPINPFEKFFANPGDRNSMMNTMVNTMLTDTGVKTQQGSIQTGNGDQLGNKRSYLTKKGGRGGFPGQNGMQDGVENEYQYIEQQMMGQKVNQSSGKQERAWKVKDASRSANKVNRIFY